jgi:hypothetical protein
MRTANEWVGVVGGAAILGIPSELERQIKRVQADTLREAAEIANAQVDLPEDKIPNASIKNNNSYIIGIRRGNVNAANAILARAKELEAE